MLSFPVPGEMRTEFRFSEMRDKRLNLNETTHGRPSKGSIPVFSEIICALRSGVPCTTTALISVAQAETVLMYLCAEKTVLCYFGSSRHVSFRPAVIKKKAGRRRSPNQSHNCPFGSHSRERYSAAQAAARPNAP